MPNSEGRVLGPDGAPLPGEYVAGWLKRGPTGVIGTNKSDAAGSVRSLLADLAGGACRGPGRPGPFAEVLAARGVRPVSYADWLRVEHAEAALAAELGRGARVKLRGREALEASAAPRHLTRAGGAFRADNWRDGTRHRAAVPLRWRRAGLIPLCGDTAPAELDKRDP